MRFEIFSIEKSDHYFAYILLIKFVFCFNQFQYREYRNLAARKILVCDNYCENCCFWTCTSFKRFERLTNYFMGRVRTERCPLSGCSEWLLNLCEIDFMIIRAMCKYESQEWHKFCDDFYSYLLIERILSILYSTLVYMEFHYGRWGRRGRPWSLEINHTQIFYILPRIYTTIWKM